MPHEKLIETFKKTFLSVESDIDGFMALVAPDCEWTIMATGEKFTGTEQVRELAERSTAARTHTEDIKMKPTTLFATDDYFVIEYLHRAIVTENWPASKNRPAPGTLVSIPICIVAHIRDEKFNWLHEYFDLATASGTQGQKLYS
jgi:ketosteroid isomerase-like protein